MGYIDYVQRIYRNSKDSPSMAEPASSTGIDTQAKSAEIWYVQHSAVTYRLMKPLFVTSLPVSRWRSGEVKFGEMERDCLITHDARAHSSREKFYSK